MAAEKNAKGDKGGGPLGEFTDREVRLLASAFLSLKDQPPQVR